MSLKNDIQKKINKVIPRGTLIDFSGAKEEIESCIYSSILPKLLDEVENRIKKLPQSSSRLQTGIKINRKDVLETLSDIKKELR